MVWIRGVATGVPGCAGATHSDTDVSKTDAELLFFLS